MAPMSMYGNGSPSLGGVIGGMSANLMMRRRFFQSAAGTRWDEELSVVDEKVEGMRCVEVPYRVEIAMSVDS